MGPQRASNPDTLWMRVILQTCGGGASGQQITFFIYWLSKTLLRHLATFCTTRWGRLSEVSAWGSRKVAARTFHCRTSFLNKVSAQEWWLLNMYLPTHVCTWAWDGSTSMLSIALLYHPLPLFYNLQSLILTVTKTRNTPKLCLKTCSENHLVDRVDFPLLDL